MGYPFEVYDQHHNLPTVLGGTIASAYPIPWNRHHFFLINADTWVATKTIERDRKELAEQATKFFYLLAKDNHEYNFKLKITIDSLESILCDLKKEYKLLTNIIASLKIADSMLRYEKGSLRILQVPPMAHQLEPEPEYTSASAESALVSTITIDRRIVWSRSCSLGL